MTDRNEWAYAITDRCMGAIQLSSAFAENSDDVSNYSVATPREMGDLFAVASGVALLCRSLAADRGAPPSTIKIYDGHFSVFLRYAFKCLLVSDAYDSLDQIQEWCRKLTSVVAEGFQHHNIDPLVTFDVAMKAEARQRLKSHKMKRFFGFFIRL